MSIDQLPAHSPLGASSYERWGNCPGSIKLSIGIETTSSVYAEEGTLAHGVSEDILRNKLSGGSLTDRVRNASDEMLENVQVYVDWCMSQMTRFPGERPIFAIERKFHLKDVHRLLFGTADWVCYFPRWKLLVVGDLKYGQGKVVEVEKNVQLLYYALGAFHSLGVPVNDVEITIIQPRAFHPDGPIRTYRTDVVELLEFAADLEDAAKRTELDDAPLIPGGHCQWCPAKALCPALAKQANEIAKEEFRDGLPYDPEKLGEALQALPAMEAYVKGLREFAYAELNRGRTIPGWKLVEKRATRKWVSEEAAKVALSERLDIDTLGQCTERILKSPTQIEKLLGKKKFQELNDVVVSVSSGTTLVQESDPRSSASQSAATIFDDIPQIQSSELLD